MLLLSRRPRLRRRHNGTAVAPATWAAPAAAYIRRRRIGRPLVVPVRPVFTVTFVAEHDTAAGAAGPARRPSAGRPGAALLTGTHAVTHGHEGGHTFSSELRLKKGERVLRSKLKID
jgi:hypothetical protein